MGKMGSFNAAALKKFQEQLSKIAPDETAVFVDSCAKELAARLLAKVIKRTPVGSYPASSGKKGGTLRRGWTAASHEAAAGGGGDGNAAAYAESLPITRSGGVVTVEIINPVNYASYVEFGHRTANHQGWVEGRFMLTISEQEIETIAPKVLESRVKRYLEACMG